MLHVTAFFRYIWETIKAEKMPVWLTLLGIVVTAYATYVVAPFLNSKFEVQKAQSQYVMENLKYINEETAKLFALFSEIQTIEETDRERKRLKTNEINGSLVKLIWKSNEYEMLFLKDIGARQIIIRY